MITWWCSLASRDGCGACARIDARSGDPPAGLELNLSTLAAPDVKNANKLEQFLREQIKIYRDMQ